VEIVSDRRYRFALPPDALWSALAATDDYRRWWPWLRTFEADGLRAGDRWSCAVRPPLPYTLQFAIHLDDVVPPRLITAHVTGDIAGEARVEIAADRDGCHVHLTSRLAPGNRAFAVVARVAQPVVRRGHDWVLDTGAAQFASHAVSGGADRSAEPTAVSRAGRARTGGRSSG
jgi:uncharacterized protein YndB with AHSA1/START domain